MDKKLSPKERMAIQRQAMPEQNAAERARKVGDGGVDADHQVELADDGRRVGEVGELRAEAGQPQAGGRMRGFVLAGAFLQADEADARNAAERCQDRERVTAN